MAKNKIDIPWKDVLDHYFQAFIFLCYPKAANAIDWSLGHEMLDKELSSIADHEDSCVVDKLIKVKLKNGISVWILFHIEVQGQRQKIFPKRMYIYHYRLYDKYRVPIINIAILADGSFSWRPSSYHYGYWGCKMQFNFITIKLLDFVIRKEELNKSTNPFAVVILAQLHAIETKKNSRSRYDAKLQLTRSLYEKGLSKEDVVNLYTFIDWVMALPEELELNYHNAIESVEQEKNMRYITTAERIGIKKGMQQGMLQGEKFALQQFIQKKFGMLPAALAHLVDKADAETILKWLDAIVFANSLEEVFHQ